MKEEKRSQSSEVRSQNAETKFEIRKSRNEIRNRNVPAASSFIIHHSSFILVFLLSSVFCLLSPIFLHAQARTTITDTLYDPSGGQLNGFIIITNPTTFTSADGFAIPAGSQIKATVTNGWFSVALVPNIGAIPSGTSYAAAYYLNTTRMQETWVVPATGPVNLLAVRALTPPVPAVMLPIAQINPPSPCAAPNNFLTWGTNAWVCAAGGSGGGSGTVTSFSAGNLSPLFTSSVATATTTPALSFTLSNFGAHSFFGNNTGSAGAPGAVSIGAADLPATAVFSVVNDTNVTGSIAAQALALGWTGTLAKGRTLATTVYTDQANTYTAGMKQVFAANATNAGEGFGGVTADPSTLAAGDRWFRTDLKQARIYDGSTTQSYLFQSRNVNASAPLGGGGSLGGDLTLTCSTCVTGVTASSPLASSGGTTPAISVANQNANLVFAGPSSGGAAAPTFRALVGADLPSPAASTLGGIESLAAVASKWINTISTSGVPSATQPAFTDISGTAAKAQLPATTVFTDQANTYTAGQKQTFAANATNAGEGAGGVGVDPSTLVTGDRWYRTDLFHSRLYANGSAHSYMLTDDSLTCAQHPALTGDTTSSAGSCATTTGRINGAATSPTGGTNSQTVNYTAVAGDSGKLISMNGSSLTLTLPSSPPNAQWHAFISNLNATSLTVARNGLNIDGSASNLTLTQNQEICVFTDNSNYFTGCKGAGGGSGTVTSAALAMPGEFSVSGSPITTSGTFTVTKANQNANLVFAGPSSGAAAAPTFRALVPADGAVASVSAAGLGGFFGVFLSLPQGATGNTTTFTANQVRVFQFVLPYAVKVGRIVFNIATLHAGGHCDFGIYDTTGGSGSGGNLLLHTGSITTGSAGVISTAITAVTLNAGTYYLAYVSDDTTVLFSGTSSPSAAAFNVFNQNAARAGTAATAASAGVLPASTGVITASALFTSVPVSWFEP